jgi:hypothetical protein
MKKNQFTLIAATFITGIIIGMSAITLFSFTSSSPVPASTPPVSKISVTDAKVFFKTYYDKTPPVNAVIKGFSITKEHLAALNNLSNENPALTAFRIYMGYDASAGNIGLVVGVDGSGQDITTSIYRAAAGSSGPCPTVCDANSPITSR